MDKNEVFRDTRDWYLENKDYIWPNLIKFTMKNAGKRILDLGCATGEYCSNLEDIGFKCTGVDINPKYIEKALEKGIDAYEMEGDNLNFPDDAFDTVLIFEVLEHIPDPYPILKEARRVARKNILITVPNSTQFAALRSIGLTYEHVLEKDHVNFFTREDLEDLISKEFKRFEVVEDDPIDLIPLITKNSSKWLKLMFSLFNKFHSIKPALYNRLYAVIEVDK